MPLTCKLHITSRGNLFVRDLAQLLADVLVDIGVVATVVTDSVPLGEAGVADVIVGPQEFLVIDTDLPLERRQEIAAASVLVTTEQPGSPFWDIQREFCTVAGAVVDINGTAVRAFAEEGIDAHRLHLGYHPSLDLWGGPIGHLDTGRDLDVAFLGGASHRHLQLLSLSSAELSHRHTQLLLHDPLIPVRETSPGYVSGLAKAALLRRTKILLNVHNSESGYFEWLRAIEAISNGALLVSEPSSDIEPLVAFEHLVTSDAELFGAHITALLADEPRRVAMASAAYDVLRSDLRMTDRLRTDLLPILEAQAETSSTVSVTQSELRRLDPGRPRDATAPDPFQGRDPELVDTAVRLQTAVVDGRNTARELARAELLLAGEDPDLIGEITTPAWDAATECDISVIVPLYNYEDHLTETLDSAFASRGVTVEVIVVDDASTDSSVDVLRAYLEAHPDRPMLGLLRPVNAGPSPARNLGRARARRTRLFLLDADNELYPDGLAKLKRALDESGTPVAYGILEMHGDFSHLVSAMPWNVESLLLRPYIDNMALVDADVVERVGGFPDDEVGLEDYRFYVALAANDEHPVWVPEIVGRYNIHLQTSRSGVAALNHRATREELRSQHPHLPWPVEST